MAAQMGNTDGKSNRAERIVTALLALLSLRVPLLSVLLLWICIAALFQQHLAEIKGTIFRPLTFGISIGSCVF
jgi:hypothetical protein